MVEFIGTERFKALRGKAAILIAETQPSPTDGYTYLDFNVEYPLEDNDEATPIKLHTGPSLVLQKMLEIELIKYAKEHKALFVYMTDA